MPDTPAQPVQQEPTPLDMANARVNALARQLVDANLQIDDFKQLTTRLRSDLEKVVAMYNALITESKEPADGPSPPNVPSGKTRRHLRPA